MVRQIKQWLCVFIVGFIFLLSDVDVLADVRKDIDRSFEAGRWQEAYDGYKKIFLVDNVDARYLQANLSRAMTCLNQLGRTAETDSLLDEIVGKSQNSQPVLLAVAEAYHQAPHYGYIVSGVFRRGWQSEGGRYVVTENRDRSQALQLAVKALNIGSGRVDKSLVLNSPISSDKSDYRAGLALLVKILSRNTNEYYAWMLGTLTSLDLVPDYDDDDFNERAPFNPGAPIDELGNLLVHRLPAGFQEAKTDGERLAWVWQALSKYSEDDARAVLLERASFYQRQFDVYKIREFSRGNYRSIRRVDSGDFGDENFEVEGDGQGKGSVTGSHSAHFDVANLADDETITRLPSGIARIKLPSELNFISMFKELVGEGSQKQKDDIFSELALQRLVSTFQDRQQLPKAAQYLRLLIKRFPKNSEVQNRKDQLAQIVGAWGRFVAVRDQVVGDNTTVTLAYRNAASVTMEVVELDFQQLLADVVSYIKSKPDNLDWNKIQVDDIGMRIVREREAKYRLRSLSKWTVELLPDAKHLGCTKDIVVPVQKAGAYLVTAQVAGGNTSSVVLWQKDTVIVRKPLANGYLYFVADARSGRPLADMKIDLFGYYSSMKSGDSRLPTRRADIQEIVTKERSATTNQSGLVALVDEDGDSSYQWLITAKNAEGRMAFLGFAYNWGLGGSYDPDVLFGDEVRPYLISDRPVYRPAQEVQFKVWLQNASFQGGVPKPARRNAVILKVYDPLNAVVFEESYEPDNRYGGFAGKFVIKEHAALGEYRVEVEGFHDPESQQPGSKVAGHFRVEEYKKPEFEVIINVPFKPVSLGDKTQVEVAARYYFGAPVTEARVKLKVLRHEYALEWYPPGKWDWLYRPGYFLASSDYPWLNGWGDWGYSSRRPPFLSFGSAAPEIVIERDAVLDSEGKLKFEIDTRPAAELFGDRDHRYEVKVELTDRSRRSVSAVEEVMVARKPFKVFAWVDRGYYRQGDTVKAEFFAQTFNRGAVQGKGELRLLKLIQAAPESQTGEEVEAGKWALDTDSRGMAKKEIQMDQGGHYRLSYVLRDPDGNEVEGGYVFSVLGSAKRASEGETVPGGVHRFAPIELIPDAVEYKPNSKLRLLVNTRAEQSSVLLFIRPRDGVYQEPQLVSIKGQSTIIEIPVTNSDLPNFFIEGLTIDKGNVSTEVREIIVPPVAKILNAELTSNSNEYRPGGEAEFKLQVSDSLGKPFVGNAVMTVYDRALESISQGSNVPSIREFYWKQLRNHRAVSQTSFGKLSPNVFSEGEKTMASIGAFGDSMGGVAIEGALLQGEVSRTKGKRLLMKADLSNEVAESDSQIAGSRGAAALAPAKEQRAADAPPWMLNQSQMLTVRRDFADIAYWNANISIDKAGLGVVKFKMPENLTEWKARLWVMGPNAEVGEVELNVLTTKKLIVRLQTPRFLVEKDELVISANVHNFLPQRKRVEMYLKLETDNVRNETIDIREVSVGSGGESGADWLVKVLSEGEAKFRVYAKTDDESDAMELTVPVHVHGAEKTESVSGSLTPSQPSARLKFSVPKERKPEASRLELRYSPSMALALVDALPYLVSYPYGCTEQTLNRFLPTVITRKLLLSLGLDLASLAQKRTNLNAQEMGDEKQRKVQRQRLPANPVFDEAEVKRMTDAGLQRLLAMQNGDGGWGWFSGSGEVSGAHLTAYVVQGLLTALEAGIVVPAESLSRGLGWLKHYQNTELQKLKNAAENISPNKSTVDNLDAFVYLVLGKSDARNAQMKSYLIRQLPTLSVYGQAMLGLAFVEERDQENFQLVLQLIKQYIVEDAENQTAWLRLPGDQWWYWYRSEFETAAYVLSLLVKSEPKGELARRLAKYLINSRKHGSYWQSTRDTAIVIEALAEYILASGELTPEVKLDVLLDGKRIKSVSISKDNLFSFDNRVLLSGEELTTGPHEVEFVKQGEGPLYFNAYLRNFSLEDSIPEAGLEVKIRRRYFKLQESRGLGIVPNKTGQPIEVNRPKYERKEVAYLGNVQSGDLLEVELEVESKNDYEYLLFEDFKPAGMESSEVRSGYNLDSFSRGVGGLGAYVEYRDDRVAFFVREVSRGKHNLTYRLRAETPGRFSALPARAQAMYAPELTGNSAEWKVVIEGQ